MPPTIFWVAALLVVVSVPAVAVGLGVVFDRLCRGRPIRLGLIAVILAAVASVALLVAPLRTERVTQPGAIRRLEIRRSILEQEGLRGVAIAAIPVAVATLPLLLQALLSRRRAGGSGRAVVAGALLASLAVLVGAMYYAAAALVGFLYLPSIAALGAAAVRTWSPRAPGGPAGRGARPAFLPWGVAALGLVTPILAALASYAAVVEDGATPEPQIARTADTVTQPAAPK